MFLKAFDAWCCILLQKACPQACHHELTCVGQCGESFHPWSQPVLPTTQGSAPAQLLAHARCSVLVLCRKQEYFLHWTDEDTEGWRGQMTSSRGGIQPQPWTQSPSSLNHAVDFQLISEREELCWLWEQYFLKYGPKKYTEEIRKRVWKGGEREGFAGPSQTFLCRSSLLCHWRSEWCLSGGDDGSCVYIWPFVASRAKQVKLTEHWARSRVLWEMQRGLVPSKTFRCPVSRFPQFCFFF